MEAEFLTITMIIYIERILHQALVLIQLLKTIYI